MHVLFVEPAFPGNQARFVHALSEIGATVTAIGEAPVEALPDSLNSRLHGYEQVGSVCDEGALLESVRRIQGRGWVDRLEATVEAHVLPAARVREATGIPGTSVQTAFLCRDKPAMKEALRKAGVPCAASTGVSDPDEARRFAEEIGFPLIIKPRGSAGAAGTDRVNDLAELEAALASHGVGRGGEAALEEFVEGHEAFFDTLTIEGEIRHSFISHYYPGVLEAMRTRWISPYLITTNRVDAENYGEVHEMGRLVNEALGIDTSATHMEWFFGPKGLRFSEIGCRPPGVLTWDLYSTANDFDLYREWALAVTERRCEARLSRRYSAALLNFRPDRDGRIVGYEGLDWLERELGDCVIDSRFPSPGTPTQPVEAGYMANAWVRVRHPDYDRLRELLDEAGRRVQVRAG